MGIHFKNDWEAHLQREFSQDYYLKLRKMLVDEYNQYTVYPDMYDIFNAFHYTGYMNTKVCIIGQDPYHGPGQAHGLSFSVMPGTRIPPSLQNIYQELHNDLGCPIPKSGYLKQWADEGVLLLNAVLTVRAGQAASHKNLGWHEFTDHVIEDLGRRDDPIVFVLWGSFAQSKIPLISNPKHCIIKSPHPSPLSASRGFFGSQPFSKANAFLKSVGKEPIDWCIR